MADNSINCVNGGAQFINFGSFTPSIGQFYSADNLDRKGPICLEITGLDNNTSPTSGTFTAQTLYDSCLDCFIDNCGYIELIPCDTLIKFNVFISGLTFIPEINDVYYCSILGSYSENQPPELYEGCFTVTQRFLPNSSAECNKIINSGNYAIVNPGTTFTAQTDCPTCIINNPSVYEVRLCESVPPVYYYINLPIGLERHLISFESDGEQFCGIVSDVLSFSEITATYISDFGEPDEGDCTTCLEIVSQKILLRDCLDSENEIVVWGSSLYGLDGASNLSTDDGCFEVIGETTSAVTYSGYLDYNPQPNCNTCISCSGLRYEFSGCVEQEFIVSYFFSNQILSVGDVFHHPRYTVCCIITDVTSIEISNSTTPYYSSVLVFGNGETGCTSCSENQPLIDSYWQATICGDSVTYPILVNCNFNVISGDIVKIKQGENDFLCVELTSEPAIDDNTSLYLAYTSYTTCEECLNTVEIGTTLLNCNTNQPSYVSLNQSDWLTATGFYLPFPNYNYYIPYSTVKLSDGKCYNLENPCVLPLTATTGLETVSEFNLFCSLCSEGFPPRSANTETIICGTCDGAQTVFEVIPPHPVWTDGYGTSVTQMNSVTLGGMFGLNS